MSRKPHKKHARRRARENALALLYSGDIVEQAAARIVEEGAYPSGITLSEYSEQLIEGVCSHQEEIDARLDAASENWALDRMPVVDRVILRLAVYEMLFVDDVPMSVAINEAVELAKMYGGEDDSSRFVNGVLGKIARAEEARAAAEKAESEALVAALAELKAEGSAAEGDEGAVPAEEPAGEGETEVAEAAAEPKPAVEAEADPAVEPEPAADEPAADPEPELADEPAAECEPAVEPAVEPDPAASAGASVEATDDVR